MEIVFSLHMSKVTEQLGEQFVNETARRVERGFYYGTPITDLTRDELLCLVSTLVSEKALAAETIREISALRRY